MRIVVVGGSGFIGTHLVRALRAEGAAVRIFDRAPSLAFPDLVEAGDVRDAAALEHALRDCDVAIDLAAEHGDDVRPVQRYFDTNVGGARNVVRAAQHHGVQHVLFASSAAVYGRSRPGAGEDAPLAPSDAYGRSKAEAEAVYRAWQAEQPTRRALTIVRPCAVYGEGHRGNVRRLIEQLRRGRFVLVGGGRNRKSVAYVGNLVSFVLGRLRAPAGAHCFNYADPPAPTTAELVEEIRALLPHPTPTPTSWPLPLVLAAAAAAQSWAVLRRRERLVTWTRVHRFHAETTLSTAALDRLGFRPPVDRREALARTLAQPDAG